jgi:anaerobic magnesium-protoporphyrin IX monomethyl ester cyclase
MIHVSPYTLKPRPIRRVAFIYLPTDFSEATRFYEAFQRRPPLGLQYLQATLHRVGVSTELIDGVLESLSLERLFTRIQGRFDVLGFYVSSMNRKRVMAAIRFLKQSTNIPLIVGGPGSLHAADLLHAGADGVCMGEGEEALLEMLAALAEGRDFSHILGVATVINGEVVIAPPRPLIADLDSLPFPYRETRTVTQYYDFFNPMVRKPCISLSASRGCYYRCSYCYSHRFWRGRYRLRSVENVLEEIAAAVREFSVRYLMFVDDVFPQQPTWLDSFSEKWQSYGFRLPWMCILHPRSYNKDRERCYKKLRDAGCNMISFGAQSAVPEILQNIHRKGEEVQDLLDAVRTAKRLGITTVVTYIFGLPGETCQTGETTLRSLLKLNPHLMDAHILEVLPGTEIAEKYAEQPCTRLSPHELKALRKRAFRRFYIRPVHLLRIIAMVLKNNPEWFLLFPWRPVWSAFWRRNSSFA